MSIDQVAAVLALPVRPAQRRGLAYLALSLPLGWAYLLVLSIGVATSAALIVFVVGIPLFALLLAACRGLAVLETRLANALLDTDIPLPPPPRHQRAGRWGAWMDRLTDTRAWWSLLWVTVRALLGTYGLIPHLVLGTIAVECLLAPVRGLSGSSWTVRPGGGGAWLMVPVGIGLLVALAHLSRFSALAYRRLALLTLGPHLAERMARTQERADQLARQTRLARELHDSVGHTLTLGVITAAAARQVMGTDPGYVTEAMTQIERVNRRALDDLDAALRELREDGEAPEAEHRDDLARLLDGLRVAGLPLDARVEADMAALPAGIRHEVYRIVQESCTNVLRHAGRVGTRVTVAVAGRHVEVEIRNDAAAQAGADGATARTEDAAGPAGADRAGTGLRGMEDRVSTLGGTMAAGPYQGGGFRVRCRLPLDGGVRPCG